MARLRGDAMGGPTLVCCLRRRAVLCNSVFIWYDAVVVRCILGHVSGVPGEI